MKNSFIFKPPKSIAAGNDDDNDKTENPATPKKTRTRSRSNTQEQKVTPEPPVPVPEPVVLAVAPSPPTKEDNKETLLVRSIVDDLNDILCRAMQPALTFMGKVAVRLAETDVRPLLAWNNNPKANMDDRLKIVKYADTVEEFIQLNKELGTQFLAMYLETRLEEEDVPPPVNAQITTPFNLDIYEQESDAAARMRFIAQRLSAQSNNNPVLNGLKLLGISELELKFAPAWAFEMVSNSIFRLIWSTTSLAAVEATAQAVRRIEGCSTFTVKELISSDQVSDQFAFLVSASFLNSGDGLPPSATAGRSNKRQKNIWYNVFNMRNMLAEKIFTCNIWFEMVRKRTNPIVEQFRQQTAKVLASMPDDEQKRRRILKFAQLEANLPKWELVYTGY
ncbi:MAG: hypothetical protein K2Q45_05350 [Nitrosomonas sp.]|nr:hypothetical protein [Nitrosomonas sp.]